MSLAASHTPHGHLAAPLGCDTSLECCSAMSASADRCVQFSPGLPLFSPAPTAAVGHLPCILSLSHLWAVMHTSLIRLVVAFACAPLLLQVSISLIQLFTSLILLFPRSISCCLSLCRSASPSSSHSWWCGTCPPSSGAWRCARCRCRWPGGGLVAPAGHRPLV